MATKKPVEILTAQDYDTIQAALAGLNQVPEVMERAQSCGVDCAEYAKMHQFSEDALKHILKTWFPKGRPR
jgi:hypothetical protein